MTAILAGGSARPYGCKMMVKLTIDFPQVGTCSQIQSDILVGV